MTHKKLFIPGPTDVSEDTLKVMATPMIGHRSKAFADLYAELQPKLQQILYTQNPVYLSTSSGSGGWEAAVRNCVAKKVLHLTNGAFSEKWVQVSELNGKEVEKVSFDWGKGVTPNVIDEKLATGEFDAVAIVHNETSTGVMNNIEAISEVVKKYPDVIFMVDAVSSLSGVKIEVDKLGIDICLAGVQKAFAVPPGLAIFSVSEKALEKSKSAINPGFYFNYQQFDKYHKKNNTITTPPISQIMALNHQCTKILEEGLDTRFARHKEMAELTRAWAIKKGFELYPEAGFESLTLTCIKNNKGISVAEMNNQLEEKHNAELSNGYGKLKEETFRIAHMGDQTVEDTKELLGWLDEILANL